MKNLFITSESKMLRFAQHDKIENDKTSHTLKAFDNVYLNEMEFENTIQLDYRDF